MKPLLTMSIVTLMMRAQTAAAQARAVAPGASSYSAMTAP
jgi:hypothetical protein